MNEFYEKRFRELESNYLMEKERYEASKRKKEEYETPQLPTLSKKIQSSYTFVPTISRYTYLIFMSQTFCLSKKERKIVKASWRKKNQLHSEFQPNMKSLSLS